MIPATAAVPTPPGRIGAAAPPAELLPYLQALGQWLADRRRELDQLDQLALASPQEDILTADLVLAMSVWKSVSDRYDLLMITWDSGRVGPVEAERLSTLIWGGLDTGAGTLAVSLPEACTLCDALVAALRARLAVDPDLADRQSRLRDLRAQVERIRDQVQREPATERPAAEQRLHELDQRTTDVQQRSARGADIGGLLGPLEVDAARAERDLIVAASTRRERAQDVARARALRAQLAAEGAAVQAVADQCVAAVTPAPHLAVPDVAALGPVPSTPAELASYLTRLDAVRRALGQAQTAYGAALQRRDELAGRLDAYRVKAGAEAPQDLRDLYQRARSVLDHPPVDLVRLGALAHAYQAYLEAILAARAEPASPGHPARQPSRPTEGAS